MRKIISVVLAAALVLCLSPPTYAATETSARTNLSFIYTPAQPSYYVTASVEKLNGNQNRLTITVTELYPGGTENVITETFLIPRNSEGTYEIGGYSVYVDTKGNIQVRQCEVVGTPAGNQNAPTDAAIRSVGAQFISITETAKNSKVWVLTFKATLTCADNTKEVRTYSINLNGNNANLSGKYKFADGHDLAGYTLVYDIAGNGSGVKDFKIVLN